jgi:hypothetical protein
MRTDQPKPTSPESSLPQHVRQYPLIEAILQRRSRRFAKGLSLVEGPLAYQSDAAPRPLTLAEEAALAFAACGLTGYPLAELPYVPAHAKGGGGNIMTHLVGRTVASADAIHTISVFVINDEGAWLLKRPQDFPRAEVADLIRMGREHRWLALYENSRIRIAERRLEVPREIPYVPPFNQWVVNRPGTTYFLFVAELSSLFINLLLTAFSEDVAYFVLDERNNYRPAGIARFGRSQGGHLFDRPTDGRIGTLGHLDDWLYEYAAVEQGSILQNLALMAEALGLGGFPNFAGHPFIWLQTLGFRMEDVPLSHTIGANPLVKLILRLRGEDQAVPTAVGFEREGEVLIKPFCPPYYRNMEEAVLAFIAYKFAPGQGTLKDEQAPTAWRDEAGVPAAIPSISDKAIEATIACCDYVYRRYGRFPGGSGPFRTTMAYQTHHLDPDFYQTYYQPQTVE